MTPPDKVARPAGGRSLSPCAIPFELVPHPLLIPPFGLAVFRRRQGRCQGSRGGRLAQPLTTPLPERSCSQVEWRSGRRWVLTRRRLAQQLPRRHASIRTLKGVPAGDSVHVGVRDVPVLQSTRRSQAAPAVPPRPATISQSPGLGQREQLSLGSCGVRSSKSQSSGPGVVLVAELLKLNYDRAPAPAVTAAARSAWYSG